MKNFIFYLAGAIFLFVSCQSDDLLIEEVSKPDHAMKVTKEITFRTYEGFIEAYPPDGYFLQTGGGIASHIGKYTFENNSMFPDYFGNFQGILTAANGDEIYYVIAGIDCGSNPFPCPGQDAIFKYAITGGSGRFAEAEGWLEYYGKFVQFGPFEGTGTGEITY